MMKFTESHEWIKVEGDLGTVGVTDHAQEELGDIVYVELPTIGKTVKAGEEIAVLESTKAAADIYAPVSGEIIEVNKALEDNSDLVNSSPQEKGWLFKIKVSDTSELSALMDAADYNKQIQG